MSTEEPDRLRAENEELHRRVARAEAEIAELRAEALIRRAEVRGLGEKLPAVMSRTALMRAMAHDARHHPDKLGVARRGVRKAGRELGRVGRALLRPLTRRS